MNQYFIHADGKQQGPFSLSELIQMRLSKNTPVWRDDLPDWKRANELPELGNYLSEQQEQQQPLPQPRPLQQQPPPVRSAIPQPMAMEAVPIPPTDTEAYMRKKFFWSWMSFVIAVVTILAGTVVVIGMAGGNPAAFERRIDLQAAYGLFAMGALAAFIVGVVFTCQIVYRLWQIVASGNAARTTPGKAVGFLFIPFFNFYWVFIAFWGLCQDLNKYCVANDIQNYPKANEGLAIATCVLTVASILPEAIGSLAGLAGLICTFILLHQLIRTGVFVLQHIRANGGGGTDLSRHLNQM